jgi:hypothetical protein
MKQICTLAVTIFCLLPLGADAQWAWVDKDGKKVFSDRAPSAEVPEKNILKRPGRIGNQTTRSATPPSDVREQSAMAKMAASKPAVGADKELADRLKKTEQEQESKKKADEERIAKTKADNCQRATLALKNLDSGMRISRVNAQGEREVLDDAARAAEAKRLQGIATTDCQ